MEIKITRSPRGRPYALIVFLTIIAMVVGQGTAGFAARSNANAASKSAASSSDSSPPNSGISPDNGHGGPLHITRASATATPEAKPTWNGVAERPQIPVGTSEPN